MGLWHGVEYYEKEKIVGEEYYQQWSNVSIQFYFSKILTLMRSKYLYLYKMLKLTVIDCHINQKTRNLHGMLTLFTYKLFQLDFTLFP